LIFNETPGQVASLFTIMATLNQDVMEQAKQGPVVAPAQSLDHLEDQGCVFVLRFILIAFRGRRPEDRFWSLLKQFLLDAQVPGTAEGMIAKQLLSQATCLNPRQARALLDYLSQAYAQEQDRLFWSTLRDAIQIYPILPAA
jgi:hypothetical protein